MDEPSNINTPEPTELLTPGIDICPICGMMELHVHMYYETAEELAEYLEYVGTEETDYHTGKLNKIIYEQVPPGQGTSSMFDKVMGPIMDILCDEEFLFDEDLEDVENEEDDES